jgi:predicted enzyme related to lactoylglutathione lyase
VTDSRGRFVWYELSTIDVRAAAAFYTKVMGWSAWDASVPGRPCVLFSDGKAAVSGLVRLSDGALQEGVRPNWVGYVGVDDVDATAARVKRLGGTVHVPPTDVADISRFCVFADPQAARLALFKWLKPGQSQAAPPDARGHVGWHELLAADCEQAWPFYGELFGWQRADADVDERGTYQRFSADGHTIGGILTKPPTMPTPFWLYYFNTGDIDATAQRVKRAGGTIIDGPVEVPGDSWIVRCFDPQGAMFALEGRRRGPAMGYFERATPDSSANPQGRTWSW